jgi:hypothetical protein
MGKHMSRNERMALIFNSILHVVEEKGLFRFTLADIADKSKYSEQTIKAHHGSVQNIRETLLIHAQQKGIAHILNTPITDMIGA